MITAPAGSGKSSLLRAWAGDQSDPRRLAMIQVQRGQHDAQTFWLAMLNAVRDLSGGPAGREAPTASPDFNGPMIVDRIVTHLSEQPGRVGLIIDDAHELTSRDAVDQLARLLTMLPENAHAILAARRDLPLRLHHRRLAGQLTELRGSDLRFSEDETRALLDAAGIALSDTAVTRLHQRTEGWAAGLRLAVIALTGHQDPERFVAEFTGSSRTVAEYLVAEMLDRQPHDVQDLLLRTSIVPQINGELADLLAGRPGSERILLDLEDADAFVVSTDPAWTWFRYHHLFADLLRLELRRRQPDQVRGLHRQAARWLAGHGQPAEAVRQLQAAEDWRESAELLADHSFGLMLDGQEESMRSLLENFPRGAGVSFPELNVVHATVQLVHGQLDEAAAYLAAADASIASRPEHRRPRLQVAVSSLYLSLARRRGDLADIRRHAAFISAPPGGTTNEEVALGSDLRVMALMNLGTVEAWTLGVSDGARHLLEGADLARKIGRPYLEVACLAQLGFATKLPDFAYSRQRCQEAIALAEEHGWETAPIVAPALVTLGCSMVWTGEFDEAERTLRRADVALESDQAPGIGTLLHLVKGMLQAGRGRRPEALAEFARAHELQSRLPHPHALTGFVTGWLLATQARLGATADARALLRTLDRPLVDSAEIRNARAVICLAEGDQRDALATIAPVIDGSAPAVHVATTVEARLLAALAHRGLRQDSLAREAVDDALALAEPDGLVLPFAMTGAADLLASMPRHGRADGALPGRILEVLQGSPRAAADLSQVEELSQAELRILRYLPTNLSRNEIAAELSVSVNTVSTHVRNIYARLHVTDRAAAVQRARELHLLGGSGLR